MANWDQSYENSPESQDPPSLGYLQFNELKERVRIRFQNEHIFGIQAEDDTSSSGQGFHKQGSAVIYYGPEAPQHRPDPNNTEFTSDDLGRLWFDTNNNRLHVLTLGGSEPEWTALVEKTFMITADPGVPSDTEGEDGDFWFQYEED